MKENLKLSRIAYLDPRGKSLNNPDSLEDWELIAILIGKGSKLKGVEELSREFLVEFSGLSGFINSSPSQLLKFQGLGKAKVATLMAARELVNRLKLDIIKKEANFPTNLNHLIELVYLRSIRAVRECFFLITLNGNKKLINLELISKGSLSEVGVHTRDLVKLLLDDGASYCIIAHNHPKHSSFPSSEDYTLYNTLKSFLMHIEVELIDQWVVGVDGIFSCNQRKMIKEF
ncbi:MAG: DNA repair protein [Leptospiraceae bacterium]|nr:DNA repair protein [Leptospiraceae bacterium]